MWPAVLISLLTSLAHGEYRIFQLQIENTETGQSREVSSTMDHIQYPQVYPLNKGEVVRYLDSWMCWENTNNFRPACQKTSLEANTSSN